MAKHIAPKAFVPKLTKHAKSPQFMAKRANDTPRAHPWTPNLPLRHAPCGDFGCLFLRLQMYLLAAFEKGPGRHEFGELSSPCKMRVLI